MHARVLAIHQRLLGSDLEADGRYRVLATALGVIVHLTTVGLVVFGAWVWTTGAFLVAKVILSVLVAVIAWEVRPRLHKPDLHDALRRSDAPSSFAVVDAVAAVTRSRAPDVIAVSADVNASWGHAGFRGPRVLTIGLPLWNALGDDQRIALLAHECGHDVNGDIRSLIIAGTAIDTLHSWAWLLRPTQRRLRIGRGGLSLFSIAELFVPVLLLPLSVLTGLLAVGLARIAARSGQRAEYQADDLAAVAAGTEATVALLDQTLVAERTVESMRITSRADRDADVWARQRELVASIPHGQRERWRRLAGREQRRTDASHPPTLLREDMLRSRPVRPGGIDPATLPLAGMTEELFTRRNEINRQLRDDAPE